MFSSTPIITEAGITCLVRAAGGEQFTFTKFQVGSGVLSSGETPKTMTALKSVEIDDIAITQAEGTEDNGFIQLTAKFDNQTDVTDAFRWTELGLIAEDEDGVEYLYAYGYDNTNAETLSPSDGSVIVEQDISVIIAIGESENITVNVLPSASYASQSDFLAHTGDTNNPHGVTLAQVGGAAAIHTHAASDITSGILGVAQGGTGVNTLAAFASLLYSQYPMLNYAVGEYYGDQGSRKDINLGFEPLIVFIFSATNWEYDTEPRQRGLSQAYCQKISGYIKNYVLESRRLTDETIPAEQMLANGYGGAGIISTGFSVGYSANGCKLVNDYERYLYIAFYNA